MGATMQAIDSAAVETLSEHGCFGGVQGFYRHASSVIGLPMRFGVFRPPQAAHGPVPALIWLSGLTCNEETFAIKSGAQRVAAELGLMLVTPDTSPRDTGVGRRRRRMGLRHCRRVLSRRQRGAVGAALAHESYVTEELPALLAASFPLRADSTALFGHSMGGHGALTLGLRHPDLFKSVSAFAPIAAPSQCPWGVKAFTGYLGADRASWAAHDATELVKAGHRAPPLLVDQGEADKFLAEQSHPHRSKPPAARQASR